MQHMLRIIGSDPRNPATQDKQFDTKKELFDFIRSLGRVQLIRKIGSVYVIVRSARADTGVRPVFETGQTATGQSYKSTTDNSPGKAFKDPRGKVHIVPRKSLGKASRR